MKTRRKLIILMIFLCSAYNSLAQEITEKRDDWKFIKLSYAKGFKTYGFQNFDIKDQNVTSVIAAEINVFKQHGFYAEFINQPLMTLTPDNKPTEIDFVFFSSYYEGHVRSRGFNIGYAYTHALYPKIDIGARVGIGKTYAEFKEYFTDKETLAVKEYEEKDTMTNWTIGVLANYKLPNNLGVFGEAALSKNTPAFKLGLTYYIPTK